MNTDPISDLLSRIRNAQKAGHASLSVPGSRIKQRIAEILRDEGYLQEVTAQGAGPTRTISITLKYDGSRAGVIDGIKRVSSPGLRVYRSHDKLESVRGGLGVSVLSTSQGVMSDLEAKRRKLGGEVLCSVW